jgi:hypothetical protein
VHVPQFLHLFLMTPHVEIMKSPLPELARQRFFRSERKQKLILRSASFLSTQPTRHSLLQNLHYCRRSSLHRLAQQKLSSPTGREFSSLPTGCVPLQPCGDLKTSRPRGTQMEMYVIRHHHVSNQQEPIAVSHLSQYFCEHTSGSSRSKQRHPPIASACNKMQIVFAVIAFQVFGHECESAKPHPLRAAKDGPPRFAMLLRGEGN